MINNESWLVNYSEEHDALGRRPSDYVSNVTTNAGLPAHRQQGLGLGNLGSLGLGRYIIEKKKPVFA